METARKTRILAGLAFAELEAHESSKRFGYWEKERNLSEAFALIHRDTALALEAVVVGDGPSGKLNGYTRAEELLANVIIRILDIGAGKKMHITEALIAKMDYNEQLSKALRKDF